MNKKIEDKILEFIKARNWEQFHTPKNLSIAIGAEVGELLECFQWKSDKEIDDMIISNNTQAFADEIADIYTYLISLCRSMNINLDEAVMKKLEKNNQKYPIEKSFGNSKKYTEL